MSEGPVVQHSVRSLWDRRFLRFLVVGGLNTAFGYGVYSALVLVGLLPSAALLCATVLGVLFNFKTTGAIVFGSRDNRILLRFVAAYVLSYVFNLGLLELVRRGLHLGPLVAQAVSLPMVVVFTYGLMKALVFRTEKR